MKPPEYAEKAISLSRVPFGDADTSQAASITLRSGYPEPGGGVVLISGPRGRKDGGIDWVLDNLRVFAEELIEDLVNDCIMVVNQSTRIPDESRDAVVRELREHFEIVVH